MLRNKVFRVYAMRNDNLFCVATFNNKDEASKYTKQRNKELAGHFLLQYDNGKLLVLNNK